MPVAVNVSERSLLDPRFPSEVESLLERWGAPGDQLQLELTERGLIGDVVTAMDVIERICSLGVRISVDDFGTGYSSLGRLVELPIQELKIDRSFVMDMGGDVPARRSSARRSTSATTSASRSWPRGSRPRSSCASCARSAATPRRAFTCSARCRPTRWGPGCTSGLARSARAAPSRSDQGGGGR